MKKILQAIRLKSFRAGLWELLIVIMGLVFVRKEVYLKADFTSLMLYWQEYVLLVLCFVDGFLRDLCRSSSDLELSLSAKKRSKVAFAVVLFLYVAGSSLSYKANLGALRPDLWRDLGLLFVLLSIFFGLWAYLKRPDFSASEFKAGTGIWKYLRYPEKTALLLMLAGISLTLGSWLTLFVLPGVFVLFKWELESQESFRINQFGNAYLEYTTQSWCLVPFIY